jgi:hypothetical protein
MADTSLELEALIAETTEALGEAELTVDATELPGIKEVIGQLRAEKDKKATLEAELKSVNKQIEHYTKIALELMEASGIQNIRVEGIGLAYQHTSLYPSVKDPDALLEWAREFAPEIVKVGVHPQTLKSFIKERLETGEPIPDESVVSIYYDKSVNLRRA